MIRVDYAGPGGACEGLRTLGLTPVGIEWDAAACATRAAAGHLTIRADLATYRPPKATGAWLDRRQQSDGVPVRLVPTSEPAPTLTGQAVGQWVVRDSDGDIASGFTLADALAIQGFPADYPVQGGTVSEKGQQVGNAVPPPLAAHIVAALTPVSDMWLTGCRERG